MMEVQKIRIRISGVMIESRSCLCVAIEHVLMLVSAILILDPILQKNFANFIYLISFHFFSLFVGAH